MPKLWLSLSVIYHYRCKQFKVTLFCSFNFKNRSAHGFKMVKRESSREDTDDNCLYCPASHDFFLKEEERLCS